jgi:hypothetical protein
MIDRLSDQRGGNPHAIAGQERKAWNHLLRKFNLKDTFEEKFGQLKYTWDNWRKSANAQAAERILRTIDRGYATRSSKLVTLEAKRKIVTGYAGSDHYPILFSCQESTGAEIPIKV